MWLYAIASWNKKRSRYVERQRELFTSLDDAVCALLDGFVNNRFVGGHDGDIVISRNHVEPSAIWIEDEASERKRRTPARGAAPRPGTNAATGRTFSATKKPRSARNRKRMLWTTVDYNFENARKWSPFDMQVKCPNAYARYARLYWLANSSTRRLRATSKVTFMSRRAPMVATRRTLIRTLYNEGERTNGWIPSRSELFRDDDDEVRRARTNT